MASPPSNQVDLGSATWLGTDEYEDDSEFTQRANKFLQDIKWDRLTTICSNHRDMPCHLSEKFSIGHFNMVRQVVFEDGKQWVVRLRMPDLEEDHRHQDVSKALSSEAACMKFFRTRSSIPVPELYHFEPESDDVGAPYMIMEYIPGIVASELRDQVGAPLGQFGTTEQDQRFRRQMAALQVEMA